MKDYKIDIKFIDASKWQELSWYNSGGTRAKKVLQDNNGKEYYFKCSEKKPAKDGKPEKHYKFEFWNEIIAYQLGKNLGLNMLHYDVAIFGGEIGCISPKMTITDKEQLIEIGRFMTAINAGFLPEDYKTRTEYTFQLLEETITYFKLHKYSNFFFETLLFDTIIGNTDRHQENWAFIGNTTNLVEALRGIEDKVKLNGFKNLKWYFKLLYRWISDKQNNTLSKGGEIYKLINTEVTKTAPIYDSGSSMARELTDNKIDLLLNNDEELEKYISNGKTELHWHNKKISHYQLVEEMLNTSYMEQVLKASKFLSNWHQTLVESIIYKLDIDVPNEWKSYCLPNNRKNLIIKLVTLRLNRLNNLISARI
jgi:hypothetical protein